MKIQIDLSKLNDFGYYARNLLYIQTGSGLIPFNLENRYVQRKINTEWERCKRARKPVRFIILKARRHGVSTLVQGRMFHECHTKSYQQGITIAADDEGCSYIHNMCHIFYDTLSPELRPMTRYKSKNRLVFDMPKAQSGGTRLGLKSSMKTVSCTNRAALGIGNHYIHFSEYAMYRDADSVRKAVIPTSFNIPNTFVIIESTANGLVGEGEPFYREWQRAKAGESVFTPMFFSWLEHEEYRLSFANANDRAALLASLDDEEKELVGKLKATPEQLHWRRQQVLFLGEGITEVDGLKSGLDNFHEQYPATDDEAFIVSGNPVFNRTKLREYKVACDSPKGVYHVSREKMTRDASGRLKLWEYPKKDTKYVIGVDAASGEPGSTDYACMQVLRVPYSGQSLAGTQCAEWHGRVEAEVLAELAITVAKYYNNALLAPEVFGYGHAVLSRLQSLDYWNIIKRVAFDAVTRMSKTRLGWKTDATTKPTLLTYGRYSINNGLVVIHSEDLVDEMMIFVRDRGGSGASAYGRGKDDRVMSFLIALKAIEIEFLGRNVGNMGVLDPKEETPVITVDDPLQHDPFWDKQRGMGKYKSWLDQ